jgi:hypothetical protein
LPHRFPASPSHVIALLATLVLATPAWAVLDIDDHGPVLDPGGFRLRVTNAGILGNAFFDVGLSNDPSFEYPAHSGHECLSHAELWVGGLDDLGHPHVSGGPALEWRPTTDPADHVRIAHAGDLGTARFIDDDGDGRTDEEQLNGRDDDGDGEVDEDIAVTGDVMASSDYVDDRPEAVNFSYSNGETHQPFGLSVHEEDYGWSDAIARGTAGVRYTITNHGTSTIFGVYCGVLADLDSRALSDRAGHLDDKIVMQTYSQAFDDGFSGSDVHGHFLGKECVSTVRDTLPVLIDGRPGSGLPVVTIVGLGHTIDPQANMDPLKPYANAPGRVSFRYTVLSNSRPGQPGGVPTVDPDRYGGLAGRLPGMPIDLPDDYQVLVACGPFPKLAPGTSLTFDVALVAAPDLDSLRSAVQSALYLYHGYQLNLLPDSTGRGATEYDVGRSGLNGHEACLEPPAGVSFYWEPDCPMKFNTGETDIGDPGPTVLYEHGHCIWTDADCDICTGYHGNETFAPWLDPGTMPPPPATRATPADHRVAIAWDNLPEILIHAGRVGTPHSNFIGYRLYRLADWRGRESDLPPLQNWALVHEYNPTTTVNGEVPLASVTDTTLDYERILYEQKHYPIGRYHDVDSTAQNGFDYLYVVTTVMDLAFTDRYDSRSLRRVESPIVASFDQRVVPFAAAKPAGHGVWVVPNPFRAHADWDRPIVPGDPFPRHLDFMGLPRAPAVIRIYTVAGDFVAKLDHDGSGGNGEASWDLISRNGQDVESGIYLFTVDSRLGHEIGHFVVIR